MINFENLMKKTADKLYLPRDTFRNVSRVEIIANDTVYIENHRGILNFTDNLVAVDCGKFTLSVIGFNLKINNFSRDTISIFGDITNLDFR